MFFFESILRHRLIVLASGLFDADWYRLAHPYVVRDQVNPLHHFLKYGKQDRISPCRAFYTARYLDEYEEARNSKLNPLVYYLKYGRTRGHKIFESPPSEADRIIDSGLFDEAWYLERHPDVAASCYPALLHFMVHGAEEGRTAGPEFDCGWYLTQYPDIIGINPLVHYIDYGRKEGRLPLRPTKIFAAAGEAVASVADLDPDLYSTDFFESGKVNVVDGRQHSRLARGFEAIIQSIEAPPRAVVFLPWLVHGGADLVACNAVRAMAEEYGPHSVLVLLVDHDREEALHLLPANVPMLSFSRIDKELSHPERIELIDLLVRNIQPEVVLNVNSHAAWEATKLIGARLAKFTRLYAMLFCPDYGPNGLRSGYADLYLRQCLPHLKGIYFDNQAYIDELIEQFGIPDELQSRLVTLYQPAPNIGSKRTVRMADQPLQVLWAGRFTPQKNVDLLIKIAEAAPQFVFHIWGRGNHGLEARLKELAERCPHVNFCGPFDRFEALPLASYDAFLYTSLWDGIPNVLLEASAANLPVVASHIGGIGELVDESTGWLISEVADPDPYLAALQAIADNPQHARKRSDVMKRRLEKRHNWERYRETLARKPEMPGGILHDTAKDNSNSERASGGDVGKAGTREPKARVSKR